jgi:hypothetical protein
LTHIKAATAATDKVVEVGSERDPIGDLQDIVRAVKARAPP